MYHINHLYPSKIQQNLIKVFKIFYEKPLAKRKSRENQYFIKLFHQCSFILFGQREFCHFKDPPRGPIIKVKFNFTVNVDILNNVVILYICIKCFYQFYFIHLSLSISLIPIYIACTFSNPISSTISSTYGPPQD